MALRLIPCHLKKLFSKTSTELNFIRSFWEPHRQGDRRYLRETEDNRHVGQKFKDSLHNLKGEIKLWKDEVQDHLTQEPKFYLPGDTEILWALNSEENLKKWKVTADKDNNDGFSNCKLELSKNKKGIFHGFLDTQVPKDGIIYRSGYCNICTIKQAKSFFRESYLDWSIFTHLILNIRGDGRSYMINIMTTGSYDLQWHDMYNYVLYTRGGPYWQYVKIPFSKFFFSSKGKISDKQYKIPLNRICTVGITCADNITGPFQLEIDHIGVHFDANHTEEFAYEMYQTGKITLY